MRRLLGSVAVVVGLVGCARSPEAGQSQVGAPSAAVAPPAAASDAPSAAPAAPASAEPTTPATASSAGNPSKPPRVGGKCEYEDTPGTGTVTAIEEQPANGDCGNHPKKVTLTFSPSDAGAKAEARDKAFTLGVGGVDFVAAGCLAAYKISVGTKLQVVRHKMKSGTCSPLVYEVTALSSPDDTTKCFAFCNK